MSLYAKTVKENWNIYIVGLPVYIVGLSVGPV